MATYTYEIHLDRRQSLTGTYGGADTTWALGFTDDTINAIVLGSDFGASASTVLTPSSNSSGTVTMTGADYSAGPAILGRLFTMTVELSDAYYRDRNGDADIDAWLNLFKIISAHENSGPYTLRAVRSGVTDRDVSLSVTAGTTETIGTLEAWLNGPAKDMDIKIISTDARPCTITALKYLAKYQTRNG